MNLNRQFLIGFLFGFSILLPFLYLAYNLSPFGLVVDSNYGWGWTWKAPYGPPSHVVMGSFSGWFSILLFYLCYFTIGVSILVGLSEWMQNPKKSVES